VRPSENISFLLVEPKEPGNIGASARAIKNMGFRRLALLKPTGFPSEEARWLAHGAEDVLDSAKIYQDLKEAIKDSALIVGTSRRIGKKRGFSIPLKEGVKRILNVAKKNPVTILFGREDKGLNNKETKECAFLIHIPTSVDAPSLNLAQAVLLVAYELSVLTLKEESPPVFIKKEELDFLFKRIESTLTLIGYYGKTKEKALRSIERLLGRACLTEWEVNLLHGLCSMTERAVKRE
jgi:TrmH family RNA methyltransferase